MTCTFYFIFYAALIVLPQIKSPSLSSCFVSVLSAVLAAVTIVTFHHQTFVGPKAHQGNTMKLQPPPPHYLNV